MLLRNQSLLPSEEKGEGMGTGAERGRRGHTQGREASRERRHQEAGHRVWERRWAEQSRVKVKDD